MNNNSNLTTQMLCKLDKNIKKKVHICFRSPGILDCKLDPFAFNNCKKKSTIGTLINIVEACVIKNRINTIHLLKQRWRGQTSGAKSIEGSILSSNCDMRCFFCNNYCLTAII